jgi:hypothetical protein
MTEKNIIKKPICVLIQNRDKLGYVRLNELNSWDDDFIPISCKRNSICNKITYVSTDPRLISASHNGDKLALDTIPRNGKVQFNPRICNEKGPNDINGYKNVYNNYSDINGGDISYYYANDLANPFIPQLFLSNKIVYKERCSKPLIIKEHYIDPMDSYKPHYYREPIYSQNCLNWIKDTQFHREDLMSKQLWNRNQSSFEVNL